MTDVPTLAVVQQPPRRPRPTLADPLFPVPAPPPSPRAIALQAVADARQAAARPGITADLARATRDLCDTADQILDRPTHAPEEVIRFVGRACGQAARDLTTYLQVSEAHRLNVPGPDGRTLHTVLRARVIGLTQVMRRHDGETDARADVAIRTDGAWVDDLVGDATEPPARVAVIEVQPAPQPPALRVTIPVPSRGWRAAGGAALAAGALALVVAAGINDDAHAAPPATNPLGATTATVSPTDTTPTAPAGAVLPPPEPPLLSQTATVPPGVAWDLLNEGN